MPGTDRASLLAAFSFRRSKCTATESGMLPGMAKCPRFVSGKRMIDVEKRTESTSQIAYINYVVRWGEGPEHRLEVAAARRQNRSVGWNDVSVQNQINVAKLSPDRAEKHRQIVFERGAGRFVESDLHISAGVQALANNLNHQRLVKVVEHARHDNVVKMLLFHNECQAVVFYKTQSESNKEAVLFDGM